MRQVKSVIHLPYDLITRNFNCSTYMYVSRYYLLFVPQFQRIFITNI